MKLNLVNIQRRLTKILIGFSFLFSSHVLSAEPSSYFKDTYQSSREAFLAKVAELQSNTNSLEKEVFKYEQGEVDYFHLPPAKNKKNLIIIISGTHGVEGFAGSAVQRWMLDQFFQKPREKTGLVMVHGLNAYGFSNERRVNENNIDLNRNFILDEDDIPQLDKKQLSSILQSQSALRNESYEKLNDFLNPQVPVATHFFSRAQFFFQSLFYVMKYSLPTLRESIVKGQYQFPKGIFYGGDKKQAQDFLFDKILNDYVSFYKNIFFIDLHTGYGAKGKLHLLAGVSQAPESQMIKDIFSEDEVDFSDKKDFYNVKGDVLSYLTAKSKYKLSKNAGSVCFEYGTMDSQKVTGSIESLRRMILENQNYSNSQAPEPTQKEVKNLFREMFYPSSSEWREGILKQTRTPFEKILKYLEE